LTAAAISAVALALALGTSLWSREGVERRAVLRFGHPYAVVAVATDSRRPAWHGVPVFSAWIADPCVAT
jgi:hypothetical protein